MRRSIPILCIVLVCAGILLGPVRVSSRARAETSGVVTRQRTADYTLRPLGEAPTASVSAAAWEPLDVYAGKISAFVIDPDQPATVYAGTDGGGVFRSDDYGAVWNSVSTGLSDLYVSCMAIDPTDPTIVYAGANQGIFRSADHGTTWTKKVDGLTNKTTNCLAVSPWSSSVVYAGTNGGLWRSVNSGTAWVKILSLTAYGSLSDGYAKAIAIDPADAQTIYAGFWGFGVFRSEDGGDTWSQLINGLTNLDVTSLAVSPFAPSLVYVGTYGGGVFRSDDGGASWNGASNGLTTAYVRCLTSDPSTPGTVYAGTWYGVLRSSDSGASWTSTGLTSMDVLSLAVDPSEPKRLYAGTWTGVFKLEQAPALSLAASWNLISVPVPLPIASIPGVQAVFGYHNGWSAPVLTSSLMPGEGYWVQVENAVTVPLPGTPTTGPVPIPYQVGWQLLGNPFDVPLPMSTITNYGLIMTCYSYGPTWGILTPATDSLQPNKGYWINLSAPTTLTLTRP